MYTFLVDLLHFMFIMFKKESYKLWCRKIQIIYPLYFIYREMPHFIFIPILSLLDRLKVRFDWQKRKKSRIMWHLFSFRTFQSIQSLCKRKFDFTSFLVNVVASILNFTLCNKRYIWIKKIGGFLLYFEVFFFLVQVDGVLVQPIHSLNKKGQSPTYIP